MMTAPIWSTLCTRFLQFALVCTFGIHLAGAIGVRAESSADTLQCVTQQTMSSQRSVRGASTPRAYSHSLFLPLMVTSGAVPPTAGDGARLAQRPQIDRFVETMADGETCVTFSLHNNTGNNIRRLALEYMLSAEVGPAKSLTTSTDATDILSQKKSAAGNTASCRFEVAPGAAIAPNAKVRMSCRYAEGPDAVLTSVTSISPKPFDGYDSNYDQIGDKLAREIADVSASGADGDDRLPVLVLLDRRPLPADYATFEQAGGAVTFRSSQLTIFGGELPADAILDYAADIADHLELIGDNLALPGAPFKTNLVSGDAADATIPQVSSGNLSDGNEHLAVAILDTGLDGTHAGLRGKISGWHDVLSEGNQEIIDPMGHGTLVAGIVAGELDDFGGVAVETPLVGIRHGGKDNWRVQHFVQAIDWAIDNRHDLNIAVLNNSNVYTDPSVSRNPFWAAAAAQAVEAGIVFVNAAGDGYGDAPLGNVAGSPATEPKVLTVGAVNGSNETTYFSSRGARYAPDSAHTKPDVMAPGSNIRSLLSNQSDEASAEDQFAMESGTSVAAPHVTGQAALLAGRLFDAARRDEDADDRSGEDGWDGIDNDGDGLIDEDAGPWDFSEGAARTVKSLILMTAAEVGGGEQVPADYPNAGAVNDPRGRSDASADGWDRGQKDYVEGYGAVDIRATLDAVTEEFCAYGSDTLGPLPTDRRVWARHLHLDAGKEYALQLDGPDDADYDIFLYQGFSGPYGEPMLALRPGEPGTPIVGVTPGRADESLTFNVRVDGLYYLVVRRVDGEGDFAVHLTTPTSWTIMLYMPAELAGEANMDEEAFRLLNELEKAGAGTEEMQEVQVLTFIDYDARNPKDDNRLHATAGINGDALLYCVRKDHRPSVSQYSVPLQPPGLVSTTINEEGVASTEANMGAPETLQAFAAFAVDHFPADRYGLILWGSGQGFGWKTDPDLAVGPGNDTRHAPDEVLDSQADALDLVELSAALAQIKTKIGRGSDFLANTAKEGNLDLLGFDMGQMAQIEVATQVQPSVDVLVAPETNLVHRWSYADLLTALKCQAEGDGWNCDGVAAVTAEALARTVVDAFAEAENTRDTAEVLSALRLNNAIGAEGPCSTFTALTGCLDELAVELTKGVDRANGRNDNRSNTQVLLAEEVRQQVAELQDRNAVDLSDLLGLLTMSSIDNQYRSGAQELIAALAENGPIMLAVGRQGEATDLHGLSIYFPEGQLQPDDGCADSPGDAPFACGFANPLPSKKLYTADEGITLPNLAEENHPRPVLTGLRFATETGWGAFLNRYYKPTAQACLLSGEECTRRLSLQVGDDVVLSGLGSSDIDSQTQDHAANAWYWDIDTENDAAAELPAYTASDETIDTPCSEDCDRDGTDELDDDPDRIGPTISWTCPAYGRYKIRLIVHDDHHLQPSQLGESAHNRHWNVDEDSVTVTCFETPFQKLTPSPIVSTQPFSYTLIARGNGALGAPTAGSLRITMPTSISIDPTTLDCSGDGCNLDSQANAVTWSDDMVADQEVQVSFAATVRSEAVPHDAPYLTSRAEIFDGLITEQLTMTTPIIIKRAEPITVTPGSVVNYITVIPANPELEESAPTGLFDHFTNTQLAAYLTYKGALEFPGQSQPPKADMIGGQISWSGMIEPEEVLVIRYAIRVSEELPAEFCDAALTTNGQVSDGVDNSGKVDTTVRIVCPDIEN